jgi:protein SCO1/2
MSRWFVLIAGCLLCLPLPARDAVPASLPGDSVYQLDLALVDQDARHLSFAGLRGKPRVVSMFYASCPYMCPLIIDTLRLTEGQLDARQRERLEVLMVSFDSARDDPATLKALATKRRIDTGRWTLARAEPADVRKLAAILGIRYRALDDGEFSHGSVLILLDADGRIVARSDTMGKVDPAFVAAIAAVMGKP